MRAFLYIMAFGVISVSFATSSQGNQGQKTKKRTAILSSKLTAGMLKDYQQQLMNRRTVKQKRKNT